MPAGARQDALAVFAHTRVAAKIACGAVRLQAPFADVHANEIINPARLAFPFSVFPRAADGGDIPEPRNFRGDTLELFAITEFPGAASALQAEEFVGTGHGIAAVFPIFVKSSNIAYEWSYAGDGGEKQVIGASAPQIEGETAFGDFAAEHGVADS